MYRFFKVFYIIILDLIALHSYSKIPDVFSLEKKELKKQYSSLSCEIDSLYYALQYFISDLKPIEWFINRVPVKLEKYFKINKDRTYSIYDPLEGMPGGFNGQQARFSQDKELMIYKHGAYQKAIYDKDNYLDSKEIFKTYNLIISFSAEDVLIINTFKEYLEQYELTYGFFEMKSQTMDEMINSFTELIYNGNVIVCNGISDGVVNPRVFTFRIINSDKFYKWKEASHNYVLIGYNKKEEYFIAADNYGSINKPYVPVFRNISFKNLYKDITLIDKERLDNCYYIGKQINTKKDDFFSYAH